jgi:hypothetical protein
MPQDELTERARALLDLCRRKGLKLAAAESCTGGLLAATLTEIPGSSDVFERGFVTYSNEAKEAMLGVAPLTLAMHGAVSRETAQAMARGALAHAPVDLAAAQGERLRASQWGSCTSPPPRAAAGSFSKSASTATLGARRSAAPASSTR